jgi:hypothetical protein
MGRDGQGHVPNPCWAAKHSLSLVLPCYRLRTQNSGQGRQGCTLLNALQQTGVSAQSALAKATSTEQ